jgi:hypothetical protein
VFILLYEQHICVDLVYLFLFNATTGFGCPFQPSSGKDIGSQKKIEKGKPLLTNIGYKVIVKITINIPKIEK